MGILDSSDDPLDARNARKYDPRLAPAPGGDIAPTGATWDHPFTVLWNSLPPEVRQSYKSLANVTAELSPGAAVRDVVDESGNMTKAAQKGDWIGAGSGPAKMAVAALGVMPFLRSARMTTKAAQETIRAYHGSPHDFDKFNASKIGTGEGAQSYGHGLYFADREGVAKSYRDALAQKNVVPTPEMLAKATLDETGDAAAALRKFDEALASPADHWMKLSDPDTRLIREARDLIASKADLSGAKVPTGHMYEVNIHADPNRFINYDKPIAEQSDLVKQALALRQTNTGIGGGPKLYSESTGMYVPDKPNMPAGQVLPVNNPAGVTALEQAGIPGVRYLDQFSRRPTWASLLPDDALPKQPQTSNTVVFPTQQEIIEILRKYGMAPVAAGGAAATVPGLLADDQGAY